MKREFSKNERILLFFFGCVITRLLPFIILLHNSNMKTLFAVLYFFMGLGFIYNFFTSTRSKGFFGGPVWWNHLRIVHGIIYLIFSFMSLFSNIKNTEFLLLFDTLIGIIAFVHHYYIK
jgi:hypothetical protein